MEQQAPSSKPVTQEVTCWSAPMPAWNKPDEQSHGARHTMLACCKFYSQQGGCEYDLPLLLSRDPLTTEVSGTYVIMGHEENGESREQRLRSQGEIWGPTLKRPFLWASLLAATSPDSEAAREPASLPARDVGLPRGSGVPGFRLASISAAPFVSTGDSGGGASP